MSPSCCRWSSRIVTTVVTYDVDYDYDAHLGRDERDLEMSYARLFASRQNGAAGDWLLQCL
jgi:hypothetical protein